MEWIHCNKCCKQPRRNDNNFIMTSCGHIFCRRCESRDNIDKCLVCEAKCRVTQLSGSVRSDIQVYFEDLEAKLNTMVRVVRFQKNHRLNFFKKFSRMAESYKSCKMENDLLRKKLIEAQKLIHSMKKQMEEHQQSTPKNNKMFLGRPRYSPTTASLNNPRTPSRDIYENTHAAFQHIQPHLRKYSHHTINETPYKTALSSGSSTFAQSFHRQVAAPTFAKPQKTPNMPKKVQRDCYHIPPYDALRKMKMNECRRNRK